MHQMVRVFTTSHLYVNYGGSESRGQARGFYDFLALRAHEALWSARRGRRPWWDSFVSRLTGKGGTVRE